MFNPDKGLAPWIFVRTTYWAFVNSASKNVVQEFLM
ncbi:hypothetical protein B0I21_10864 [Sphingobacterium paludis]|uniref:Uncharacterized protein n=1 Tax=Sphingobacterium paludis TaxID=1476465 RepID=A0A4R7CSN0_9SPHI|nr:hypothetical protein B0I21_10864 [Sphingobacterium paludis]